jgi:hypothetical protein
MQVNYLLLLRIAKLGLRKMETDMLVTIKMLPIRAVFSV